MRVLAPVEMTSECGFLQLLEDEARPLFHCLKKNCWRNYSKCFNDGGEEYLRNKIIKIIKYGGTTDPKLIRGAQEVVSLPLHKHAGAILQDPLVKCGPRRDEGSAPLGA